MCLQELVHNVPISKGQHMLGICCEQLRTIVHKTDQDLEQAVQWMWVLHSFITEKQALET